MSSEGRLYHFEDKAALTVFWKNIALLILYGALLVFVGLNAKDIVTANEGQRAYPPLEMMETGDWVVPRLNGEPYLKKPPLIYWQTALVYQVFGVSEWTARMLSAFAGIGLSLVVYFWVKGWLGVRTAFLAGLMTVGNILILDKARQAHLDIFLALFTTLTLWQWWKAMGCLREGKPATFPILLGGIWLALANLYKIPVPFLFVFTALLGTVAWHRRWRWLLRWEWYVAVIVSLVPVAIWAKFVVDAVGWEFASWVWGLEMRNRAVASEINSAPIYFYALLLLGGFAPWSAFWAGFLSKDLRRWVFKGGEEWTWLWIGGFGSVIILSLVPSKESEYIVSAIPLLTILLAYSANVWLSTPGYWPEIPPARKYQTLYTIFGLFVAGFLTGRYLFDLRETSKRSPRTQVEYFMAAHEAGRPIALFRTDYPQILYYIGRTLPELNTNEALEDFLDQNPDALFLARTRYWKSAEVQIPHRHLRVLADSPSDDDLCVFEEVSSVTDGEAPS